MKATDFRSQTDFVVEEHRELAPWQHNASLCINFIYSQGWSKGTDGKKIGFKEGTDAPAWGAR